MTSGWVLILVLLAIVAVIALAVLLLRSKSSGRRRSDGMTSFQRQIDALSPEARRPVVDQVKRAATDDDDEPGSRTKRGR